MLIKIRQILGLGMSKWKDNRSGPEFIGLLISEDEDGNAEVLIDGQIHKWYGKAVYPEEVGHKSRTIYGNAYRWRPME